MPCSSSVNVSDIDDVVASAIPSISSDFALAPQEPTPTIDPCHGPPLKLRKVLSSHAGMVVQILEEAYAPLVWYLQVAEANPAERHTAKTYCRAGCVVMHGGDQKSLIGNGFVGSPDSDLPDLLPHCAFLDTELQETACTGLSVRRLDDDEDIPRRVLWNVAILESVFDLRGAPSRP